MKKEICGIIMCVLLIITVFPVSARLDQKSFQCNENVIGEKWAYKSLVDVPSPDGDSYRCIMFCDNHEQTLNWISLINETGFQKAWQKKFLELTIFFMLPGTILFFGLGDFRNWYVEILLKLKYQDELLNFFDTYDTMNGSGMITYLWLTGKTNRPVDFKAQPDNSLIENSWILDNSEYIPNPEIWYKAFFWYFDMPWE
jgi:hypothetical protein